MPGVRRPTLPDCWHSQAVLQGPAGRIAQIERERLAHLADARRAKLAVTQKQRIFSLGGLTFRQFV